MIYVDFSTALWMIKDGKKMARYGFTKHNKKWVQLDSGAQRIMSHLVLYYPPCERYPYGMSVPWLPSRCDLFDNDWYEVSKEHNLSQGSLTTHGKSKGYHVKKKGA